MPVVQEAATILGWRNVGVILSFPSPHLKPGCHEVYGRILARSCVFFIHHFYCKYGKACMKAFLDRAKDECEVG